MNAWQFLFVSFFLLTLVALFWRLLLGLLVVAVLVLLAYGAMTVYHATTSHPAHGPQAPAGNELSA